MFTLEKCPWNSHVHRLSVIRDAVDSFAEQRSLPTKIFGFPAYMIFVEVLTFVELGCDITIGATDAAKYILKSCTGYEEDPPKLKKIKARSLLLDMPQEIKLLILGKLSLKDRSSLISSCKFMCMSLKVCKLEGLKENDIFEYLKQTLHSSRMINASLRCKTAILPEIFSLIKKNLVLSFLDIGAILIRRSLPPVAQEAVDLFNKEYQLPRKICYDRGCSIIGLANKEHFERERTAMAAVPIIVHIGVILKDIYYFRDGRKLKEIKALEEILQYPAALAQDPILSQYVNNQTGLVPLLPCHSITGLPFDYVDIVKNNWRTFAKQQSNCFFDFNSFFAIQCRILQLKKEGDPNVQNVFSFSGLIENQDNKSLEETSGSGQLEGEKEASDDREKVRE